MRFQDEQGRDFEGRVITADRILIRSEIGGFTPELIHPDALLERARPATERRLAVRRLGPTERRKKPRSDRRGLGDTWFDMRGRRRDDALSWDEDLRDARMRERIVKRTSGESQRAAS